MNYAACIANEVGSELLKFLVAQDSLPQYVVTHAGDPCENSIIRLCGEHGIHCCQGMNVNSDEFISMNKDLGIDIVFLLWWPVIIKPCTLKSVKRGFINLHPSLLPYNRGMNPYYWSIVDGTPAGVTIHWIDEEIDRGEILFQQKLDVPLTETGERLYRRATKAMVKLFCEHFEDLLLPNKETIIPDCLNGKVHRVRDMEEHSRIDLNRSYRARDLINILRARTFSNGDSAYFYQNGKKYLVRVSIEETEEVSPANLKSASKRCVHADSKA
jgi:methionyl-tRNA formyltransferase